MHQVCRFGRRIVLEELTRGRKKKNCSMASCKPPAATVPEPLTLRDRPRTAGGQPIYQAAGIPAIREAPSLGSDKPGRDDLNPRKSSRAFGWQRHFRLCTPYRLGVQAAVTF